MTLKVVQSSLIRQVKSSGVCVSAELISEALKWIQVCSSSASASTSNQMNDLNVVLFDSHSDTMAKELLERNAKNIFLLEGSQTNADKQKEATEKLEEQNPNSNISALHASMKNVLSPSKSVKINVPLWQKFQQVIEPQIKYRNYSLPEKEETKTVMFGCVPFPTQQRALLSSLLEQLLIYYDISKATNLKQSNSINSYFEFGSFSLITFLHASHFTRLISAPLDSPELSFYGRSHRTFSYLFNTLFNVEQLSDGIGYDLSLFDPEIPLTPIKAYLKHLEKLGFEESKLYAVKIEPRPFVQLPGDIEVPFKLQKFQRDENNEEEIQRRKQVINFAYWILMAGKNPKQLKQTWEAFDLSSNDEISPPKTLSEFSIYFPEIVEKLQSIFSAELDSFRLGLYKNKTDEKVAD